MAFISFFFSAALDRLDFRGLRIERSATHDDSQAMPYMENIIAAPAAFGNKCAAMLLLIRVR
jgi:hypothetical protein